jgi:hypothetical protein
MGMETIQYVIETLELVPADPPDGRWCTAIALCSVTTETGLTVSGHGYASDVKPNQEVVDRAVNEGLERALFTALAQRDSPTPGVTSTTGSAVHLTVEQATTHAWSELKAAMQLMARFHLREMGTSILEYDRSCLPPSTQAAAWLDASADLVFTALLDLTKSPKLGMGVRSYTGDWRRGLELCLVEVMQPRPWVRQVLLREGHTTPHRLAIRSAEERALFWSLAEDQVPQATFDELVAEHTAGLRPQVPSFTSSFELEGSATALRLDGNEGDRYFVRVTHPTSNGKYVTSAFERDLFVNAGNVFVPHPLV